MDIEEIISKIEISLMAPPVIIGVGGLDCAGKTTFAKELQDRLNHYHINLLHMDDYNQQAVQKQIYTAHKAGEFDRKLADLYYRESIDYNAVIAAITTSRRQYDVTLIEGVFLFKDCLASLLDIKIFLDVDPGTARARYARRRLDEGDHRPLRVFDDIWLPAFERYVREEQPAQVSDFICRQAGYSDFPEDDNTPGKSGQTGQ